MMQQSLFSQSKKGMKEVQIQNDMDKIMKNLLMNMKMKGRPAYFGSFSKNYLSGGKYLTPAGRNLLYKTLITLVD